MSVRVPARAGSRFWANRTDPRGTRALRVPRPRTRTHAFRDDPGARRPARSADRSRPSPRSVDPAQPLATASVPSSIGMKGYRRAAARRQPEGGSGSRDARCPPPGAGRWNATCRWPGPGPSSTSRVGRGRRADGGRLRPGRAPRPEPATRVWDSGPGISARSVRDRCRPDPGPAP